MKSYQVKTFAYKCNCGFQLNVFVDYGIPQESVRCRNCSREVARKDM